MPDMLPGDVEWPAHAEKDIYPPAGLKSSSILPRKSKMTSSAALSMRDFENEVLEEGLGNV